MRGLLFNKENLRLKMMLTEANFQLLRPVVCTSRIFGLCPVTFTKVGNFYQIKYSAYLVLYSYAILFLFGVGTILGVRRDIEAGENAIRMKSLKTRYITLCDMAMVFLIALYGVISTPYRIKRFVRMLDIWSYIDKALPIPNYQRYKKHSFIFVLSVLATATTLCLFDMFIYCAQWRISNDPTFYMQNYGSFYMLYFMLLFQEIFFWHLVYFIHIRIVSLNEHLCYEKNNLKTISKKLFFMPYTLNDNAVKNNGVESRKLFEIPGASSNGDKVKYGKNTAERIQDLMHNYGKIRYSVEIMNDSASFATVMIMLSCLLHLVITPYFLLVEIFKESPSHVFMTLQVVWFLIHIGRLLIMVEPCHKCLKEHKVTQNLVSEMMLMDFDKDSKKLLKTFMSQISNAEISFNACGFFNINRNLLTSVAGAVTTYLVILFQFNGNAS